MPIEEVAFPFHESVLRDAAPIRELADRHAFEAEEAQDRTPAKARFDTATPAQTIARR